MDINEAIVHARQIAEQEGCPAGSRDCAHQHDQLADWLEELAAFKATRLTPEEVAQLKQIAEIFNCDPADPAQLKALYVKLQGLAQFEQAKQMVGSTVFRVLTPTLRIIEHEVRSIGEAVDVTRLLDDHSRIVQVYLSRPEAEAAVERLKGDGAHE